MNYMNDRFYHQNTKSISSQKLVQDQNYSNQIFYTLLSTLQSLLLFYKGNHSSQFNNKIFKGYDKVDYKSKGLRELKSQLQTHIYLFQTSRKVFNIENPNHQWQLPPNFNKEASIRFVNEAIHILREVNDEQSFNMAKDILQIIDGRFHGLYSQKINLTVNYTEAQKKSFNNSLFKNGVMASEQIDKRNKQVQNVNNVNDLQARINYDANNFTGNQMKNNQSHQHKENRRQIDQSQMDVEQSKQSNFENMSNQTLSFLVFRQSAWKSIKLQKPRPTNLADFYPSKAYYFQNETKLRDASAQLIKDNYCYIVPVNIVGNTIQSWHQQIALNYQMVEQKTPIQKIIFILSEIGKQTHSIFKKGSQFSTKQLFEKNKNVKIFYSQIDLEKWFQSLQNFIQPPPIKVIKILIQNEIVKKNTKMNVTTIYNKNKKKYCFMLQKD